MFVFLDISRSITALESLCPALEGLVLRLEGFAVGDMACWKFLCAGACVSARTRDRVTGGWKFSRVSACVSARTRDMVTGG